MPLFGKDKTDVSITVDRDTLVAGEAVTVSTGIGELDKKVQGARIELGYRNTYREDDHDSDGDRRTVTRRSDVVVAAEHLHLGDGLSGATEVTLTVPPGAPGTAPEVVDWFVRAVVDRKMARDANAVQALTVLTPAEALGHWAQTGSESTSASCQMALRASTRVVKPGDTIEGTIAIAPNEEISPRAVRVQLRRARFDPDNNTDVNDDTQIELSGPVELAAGTRHAYDFTITVPPAAPPSFQAQHNHQHWYLEGVLDMKLKQDPTVRAEVLVHTA